MKRFLSLALVLVMAAGSVPGFVAGISADSGHSGYDGDVFAPGEVLALADSLEHALEIAAAYGLRLNSYAYGIAVLASPNPELSVARSRMMRANIAGIPKLSLNLMYTVYDIEYGAFAPYPEPDSRQWHHGKDEMDTARAWEYSTGADVVVAVIDTGIDINHPAFEGRILPESYNSRTDETVKENGPECVKDDEGHGTHVSGIVAAASAESAVYGVAPDAMILVIKANEKDNPRSFSEASLLRGINYAVENGADIINMSLGRSYYDDDEEEDRDVLELERRTIADAVANGVTLIASAGNNNEDHAGYPAAYPEVIAVSATQKGGGLYYSNVTYGTNYGPEIDIAAPGVSVYSTIFNGSGYGYKTGTSMAAPNVSGVAALIKSLNPGYTPRQVRDVLCGTAKGNPGRDDYYGSGIVNAYAAVLVPAAYTIEYYIGGVSEGNFIDGRKVFRRDPYNPAHKLTPADVRDDMGGWLKPPDGCGVALVSYPTLSGIESKDVVKVLYMPTNS